MSQQARETPSAPGTAQGASRRRFLSLGGVVALTGAARIALADTLAAEDAPQFGMQCPVGAAIAISFPEVLRSIFGAQDTASLIGFTMAPQAHVRVLDPDPRSYRIEYRPKPGFVGWDDFDLYAYVDGQPRTVTVFVEVSGSFAELTVARRVIRVASATQLTAALAGNFAGLSTTPANAAGPLGAGDHILLADAAYAGTFTLGRNGGTPSDADRNGVPIVIRAENLLGARLTGKLNLNGVNGWLHGLDFDGQNQNAAIGVTMAGDHTRIMRCRFRRHRTAADQDGGAIVVSMAARYNKVWYCEFTDFDGRPISSRTTGAAALYPHVYRNHWHDNVAPPAASTGNAREGLQLGQTQGDGTPVRTAIFGLVEHNLVEDCYVGPGHDETEPFSNKSSGNVYRYNSFDNVKNYLTIRFGLDCEVYGNHFNNSGGIIVYGDRHRIIGNLVTGTVNPRRIRVFSGTQTMELDPAYLHPNGPTAPDAGSMAGFTPWGGKAEPDKSDEPVARDTLLSGNSGTLLIGEMPRDYARLRCTGTIIEQHQGTILTERAYPSWGTRAHTVKGAVYASDGHREHGTVHRHAATVAVSRPEPLSPSEVGPGAAWLAPCHWPPSLATAATTGRARTKARRARSRTGTGRTFLLDKG